MLQPIAIRAWALIVACFVAAGAVGAVSFVIVVGYLALTPPGISNGVGLLIGGMVLFGLMAAIIGFVVALPFFLVGLTAIGVPTWWALHRAKRIDGTTFVLVAAVECVFVGLTAALLFVPEVTVFVPLLAIPGGLAGRTVWWLGYQSQAEPLTPPPAPPA